MKTRVVTAFVASLLVTAGLALAVNTNGWFRVTVEENDGRKIETFSDKTLSSQLVTYEYATNIVSIIDGTMTTTTSTTTTSTTTSTTTTTTSA